MKLNKTFGRIATTLVATAMLASVAVVPAFAEKIGSTGTVTGNDIKSVTFTKAVILPEKVPVPTQEMTFTLTGVDSDISVTDGDGDTIAVENGGSHTYSETVTFSKSAAKPDDGYSVAGLDRYTMDVTIWLTSNGTETGTPLSFAEPGVYAFQLSESDIKDADWTEAASIYVYLYATREDGDVKITGVSTSTVNNADITINTSTKVDTLTNYYQATPDPDGGDPTPKANQLVISKTVDGEMGNHTTPFAFSVSVGTADDTYTIQYETDGIPGAAQEVSGGDLSNIKLSDGMKLYIYGLSAGDSYSVKEDAANDDNYDTTIKTNITDKENISGDNAEVAVSDSFGNENISIDYTNTREAVSPTGLIMDIAPYVLLVVVAAAGCFVFLRKRRED